MLINMWRTFNTTKTRNFVVFSLLILLPYSDNDVSA